MKTSTVACWLSCAAPDLVLGLLSVLSFTHSSCLCVLPLSSPVLLHLLNTGVLATQNLWKNVQSRVCSWVLDLPKPWSRLSSYWRSMNESYKKSQDISSFCNIKPAQQPFQAHWYDTHSLRTTAILLSLTFLLRNIVPRSLKLGVCLHNVQDACTSKHATYTDLESCKWDKLLTSITCKLNPLTN